MIPYENGSVYCPGSATPEDRQACKSAGWLSLKAFLNMGLNGSALSPFMQTLSSFCVHCQTHANRVYQVLA